mgnify:CR=1 FL=1
MMIIINIFTFAYHDDYNKYISDHQENKIYISDYQVNKYISYTHDNKYISDYE